MPESQFLAAALLGVFGFAFAERAVEMLIAKRWRPAALYTGISIILVAIALNWSRIAARLGPKFSSSVEALASDGRTWFVLLFLLLLYGMISTILRTIKARGVESSIKSLAERDIPALNAAIEAYVLPRRLSVQQIDVIAKSLGSHRPYKVAAIVRHEDKEASEFFADLQRAIERGGWSVGPIEYVNEIREGLWIEGKQTEQSAQFPHGPHNPKIYTLLTQAFQEAGVLFEPTVSIGPDIALDTVTIQVGKRRYDTSQLKPDLG